MANHKRIGLCGGMGLCLISCVALAANSAANNPNSTQDSASYAKVIQASQGLQNPAQTSLYASYLIAPIAQGSGVKGSPQILLPQNCPAKYIPQIYVSPVAYAGQSASTTQSALNLKPIFGVYATAVKNNNNNGTWVGWDTNLYIITPDGTESVTSNSWVMAVVQCCNPKDPNTLGCAN